MPGMSVWPLGLCVQSRAWEEGMVEEKGLHLKLPNSSRFPQLCAAFNNLMHGSQDEHRLRLSCFGLCSVAKKKSIFVSLLLMVS